MLFDYLVIKRDRVTERERKRVRDKERKRKIEKKSERERKRERRRKYKAARFLKTNKNILQKKTNQVIIIFSYRTLDRLKDIQVCI